MYFWLVCIHIAFVLFCGQTYFYLVQMVLSCISCFLHQDWVLRIRPCCGVHGLSVVLIAAQNSQGASAFYPSSPPVTDILVTSLASPRLAPSAGMMASSEVLSWIPKICLGLMSGRRMLGPLLLPMVNWTQQHLSGLHSGRIRSPSSQKTLLYPSMITFCIVRFHC